VFTKGGLEPWVGIREADYCPAPQSGAGQSIGVRVLFKESSDIVQQTAPKV